MAAKQWRNSCCNPFNKVKHSVRDKSRLRIVSKSIRERFPSILPGDKVCDSCRLKISAMMTQIPQDQVELLDQSSAPQEPQELLDQSSSYLDVSEADHSPQPTSPSPVKQLDVAAVAEESREKVNEYLTGLGMTPITKRKLQSKKYQKKKLKKITEMLQMAGIEEKSSDDGEIIAQLKEKFHTADRSEKVRILTVLPRSWSIRKIQTEFGASNFAVRKAKALVAANGILTTPNPKPGRSLPQSTEELVVNFYENDESSRLMPGKKDCMSVRRLEG